MPRQLQQDTAADTAKAGTSTAVVAAATAASTAQEPGLAATVWNSAQSGIKKTAVVLGSATVDVFGAVSGGTVAMPVASKVSRTLFRWGTNAVYGQSSTVSSFLMREAGASYVGVFGPSVIGGFLGCQVGQFLAWQIVHFSYNSGKSLYQRWKGPGAQQPTNAPVNHDDDVLPATTSTDVLYVTFNGVMVPMAQAPWAEVKTEMRQLAEYHQLQTGQWLSWHEDLGDVLVPQKISAVDSAGHEGQDGVELQEASVTRAEAQGVEKGETVRTLQCRMLRLHMLGANPQAGGALEHRAASVLVQGEPVPAEPAANSKPRAAL